MGKALLSSQQLACLQGGPRIGEGQEFDVRSREWASFAVMEPQSDRLLATDEKAGVGRIDFQKDTCYGGAKQEVIGAQYRVAQTGVILKKVPKRYEKRPVLSKNPPTKQRLPVGGRK